MFVFKKQMNNSLAGATGNNLLMIKPEVSRKISDSESWFRPRVSPALSHGPSLPSPPAILHALCQSPQAATVATLEQCGIPFCIP